MAKYEKKMMQFEAFRYDGHISLPACEKDYDETKHAPYWVAMAGLKGILFFDTSNPVEIPKLYTRYPDGEVVHIPVGYYIIRWSDTELYPCEQNLFEASYIPVAEGNEEKRCLNIQGEQRAWDEKRQELEEAVKPLHEWLCKYGDPYVTVAVTQDRATVHQEYMTTPLPVPD